MDFGLDDGMDLGDVFSDPSPGYTGGGLNLSGGGFGLSPGGGLGLTGGLDTGGLGTSSEVTSGGLSGGLGDYSFGGMGDFGGYGLTGSVNSDGSFQGGGGLGLQGPNYSEFDMSDPAFGGYGLAGPGQMSLGNPTGAPGVIGSTPDQGWFSKFMKSPFGKIAMMALAAKNPALAMGLNLFNAGKQGKAGEYMGGMFGNMVGNAVAGPLGGQVGSQLGAWGGRGLDGRGGVAEGAVAETGGRTGDRGGFGLEDLASLYAASRTNTSPYSGTAGINGGRDLSSIYGPTSQYATELRKQLERRDAAAGRRSQYGPRETELMTKLAELEARQRNIDSQTNINERNQAYQEQVAAENRRRQRDAAYVRFIQGSGLMNDLRELF